MRTKGEIQGGDKTDPHGGTEVISEFEWQIFLQGNILAKMEEKTHRHKEVIQDLKSYPSWITETMALQCELISRTFPAFYSLCSSLISNPKQWNLFRESSSPLLHMKEPFRPVGGDSSSSEAKIFSWEKLSYFQRLILVKILCPETLITSIKEFVCDQIGDHYLSFGGFDLKDVYQESTCSIPLIFILSPGCDPAVKLLKFAKDLKGSHRHLDMVSLGRGQGLKAEELINRAQMQNGRWVFLQNCHLAASWMPKLQAILEKLNSIPVDQRDPNFRLWLSSKPDPCFPVQILQKGIKMTIECPSGLKAGMQRCFDASGSGTVTPEMFDDASMANGVGCDVWKKLLFGLCLFNNIVHERKKYGTLGWNIPYEFNNSDLLVSILHLHMLLSENQMVPWSALNYLTGEVNYGGRVTDDQDRLCLENILTTFFCPAALDKNYAYSPDRVYKTLPDGITFEEVVGLISTFPSKTSANLFGMSEDAEIACQQLRAQSLVDTLTSVQPIISSTFGGSKQGTDKMVLELCDEIQTKLPFSIETLKPVTTKIATRFFKEKTLKNFLQKNFYTQSSYITSDKMMVMSKAIDEVLGNSPLVIQLHHELDTFNNLLELIHNTLSQLKLAISGEIIMTGQLEDIYHAILIQQVPKEFKRVSYESCQPLGEWVTDLFQRVEFFFQWSNRLMEDVEQLYIIRTKGASGLGTSRTSCYPGSYWLPAFSFPQGFLTAVLQTHARKLSMAIDRLEFGFELVLENFSTRRNLHEIKHNMDICHTAFMSVKPPKEGVLIFGLYLDSAMLDPDTKLLRQSPARKRFCEMPHIHLKPKLRTYLKRDSNLNRTDKEDINMYNCPVYRTMSRSGTLTGAGLSSNYVMSILLPTNQSPRYWILRGTALLCQISED